MAKRIYAGLDLRYWGVGVWRKDNDFVWEQGLVTVIFQFGPWYLMLDLTSRRSLE